MWPIDLGADLEDDTEDTSTPCPDCGGKGYPPGKIPLFSGWTSCDRCEGTGVRLEDEEGQEDYEPFAHLSAPTDPDPADTGTDFTLIDTDDLCDTCGAEKPETD